MIKRVLLIIAISLYVSGCENSKNLQVDDLDFQALIQPVRLKKVMLSNSGLNSDNILDSDKYFTWGGSVFAGEDGKYHMFYSRWPHGHIGRKNTQLDSIFDGMKGWLKYSEIAYAVSEYPDGPYKHVKTILQGSNDAEKWYQYTAHNPHIRKFGNRVYLYFVSTNFNESFNLENSDDSLRNHWYKHASGQRIGYISAGSIDDLINGKSIICEQPMMSPDQINTFHVATNPSVTKGPDDSYLMMFKSWNKKHSHMTHWIARAEHPEGPFELYGPAFNDADFSAEDPYLWYDNIRKRYYAIVKDFSNSGKLSPQFGSLALVTSEDGLNDWQPANHPLVSLRKLDSWNSESILLTHLERPQLLLDEMGQPEVLYAAASLKSPFAVHDPVKDKKPQHNTFNVHLVTKEGNFVRNPMIKVNYLGLNKPAEIIITCPTKSAKIYYTTDGSNPSQSSNLYMPGLQVSESIVIKTKAFEESKQASRIISKEILLVHSDFSLSLTNQPSERYSARGVSSLVDGLRGTEQINDGNWLGIEEKDFEVIIDFNDNKVINKVTLGFLRNQKSWIFLPEEIEYFSSNDGQLFESIKKNKQKITESDPSPDIINIKESFNNIRCRFIKIKAKNIKTCPQWHPGAGGKAWLFVDEIIIE